MIIYINNIHLQTEWKAFLHLHLYLTIFETEIHDIVLFNDHWVQGEEHHLSRRCVYIHLACI